MIDHAALTYLVSNIPFVVDTDSVFSKKQKFYGRLALIFILASLSNDFKIEVSP